MIVRLFALLLMLAMPTGVLAQDADDRRLEQRARDVVAVMRGEMPREEVFTEAFNQTIPEEQFRSFINQLTAQYGALIAIHEVEPAGPRGAASIALEFADAIARGQMQLEAREPWRVAGFRLTDFDPTTKKFALDELAVLPGEAALVFAPLDGRPAYLSRNADQPLAIGSTFKLYVLSALVRAIERGERDWNDVVTLDVRSLPSGQMQEWPRGSPVTLHTLATMMISISDNTATDRLIRTLGRDAVEAELALAGHADPAVTLPFLETRELFLLKSEPQVLERYRLAGTAERRTILASRAESEPELQRVEAAFGQGPQAIDVEWLASANDLVRVMDGLHQNAAARAILAVNSGVSDATAAHWKYIGYKGGSEPGVLNLTWLVSDAVDDWYVLSMSWNDPEAPVDEGTFLAIAQRVLREYAQDD